MTLKRLTLFRLATALCLLVVLVACGDDGGSFPTRASAPSQSPQPPPAPSPPPAVPQPRTLTIGETIKERIEVASGQAYRVTATQSGTLVVDVSYDAFFWDVILEVWIEDMVTRPTTGPWSPIIARMPVVAGQSYSFSVGIRGFGFMPTAEYTLTTSTE